MAVANTEGGCGCEVKVEFDGVLTAAARGLDHRQAIREHPVYDANGSSFKIDELIGDPDMGQVSVVVFLRSLG